MSKTQNIYTLPPSIPFLETLAKGILAGYKDQFALSDIRIFLPTRRAGRTLQDIFLRLSGDTSLILPRIQSIGDVDMDELSFTSNTIEHDTLHNIPPAISPLRRQLLLSQLVKRLNVLSLSEDHAFHMAGALGTLIDQVHTEDTSFDLLDKIVPANLADQWGISLQFLSLLKDVWPDKLQELGLIDPADRRKRLMKALIEHWRVNPPQTPVIVAGSTGSIPVTAELLKTISHLPEGEVILPGVDLELDTESWKTIEEGHPQATLKLLLERMDCPRQRVQTWPLAKDLPKKTRENLWREVMRTPKTISQWQNNLEKIDQGTFDNLYTLHCDSEEHEAHTVALILRETLEDENKTAALVTPDRNLAERVKTYLQRWDINIDDSAGQPLSQTSTGCFIKAVLQTAHENLSPVSLLTLLKHPLASCHLESGRASWLARQIDRSGKLRGSWANDQFQTLLTELKSDDTKQEIYDLLNYIQNTLAPLIKGLKDKKSPYFLTQEHIKACENLASTNQIDGRKRLWKNEEGEAASLFFKELLACFSPNTAEQNFYTEDSDNIYTTVIESTLRNTAIRPRFGTHPRLSILGQLEARLIQADRVILSGLNEDIWPALPKQDPWMSRGMKKDMALPLPERSITLSAHDFTQAASASEVFLTRSKKIGNTPSVPARWLQRLDAVCQALDTKQLEEQGQHYLDWAKQMGTSTSDENIILSPPYPKPPIQKRPKEFSVSSLELLMRDPYSLYAKKILKLSPLDPLEETPGAKDKGSFIHKALDVFIHKYPTQLPDDAESQLLTIGKDVFGALLDDATIWVSWWPRFENLASWFVAHEQDWRDRGYSFQGGEKQGKTIIGDYTLTARADRIDRHSNNHLAVIDYKTGSTPFSASDVKAGFYPQLPIEGLILSDKTSEGFDDIQSGITEYMGYWIIGGSTKPGTENALFKANPEDTAQVIEDTREGVEKVLTAYEDATRGYPSCPFAGKEPAYPNYEHLSRILEWGNSGEKDEAA